MNSQAFSPPTDPSLSRPHPAVRLHHLDAVRAGALLLGVVLHSLMPFLPGGLWIYQDTRQADGIDVITFVIHLFRMMLFMMLAGYFGRMVLQRRGPAAYLRDRMKRVGLPLVAFWPVVTVSMLVVVIAGVVLGLIAEQEPLPVPEGTSPVLALLNPGHLWFLLVLIELIVITVLARGVLIRVLGHERAAAWSERIGHALSSPAGLLLAAVPYALGILVQGHALFGIIQPTTVIPELGATIAYLGAFLVGWFLHARSGGISRTGRRWAWQLPLAMVLSVGALAASGMSLAGGTGALAVAAVLSGLAGWAWCFALIGVAERVLPGEAPAVRYLADASYWIYLLHLPLLLAVGIPLAPLGWPILLKLAITWTVTMGLLLLSYDLMVRSTWIGAWLNGRRRPRALLGSVRD